MGGPGPAQPPLPLPQAQDPQGAVVAEAAAPHEDPGQVQGQLRGVGRGPAGAHAASRARGACHHLDAPPAHFVTFKLFMSTLREHRPSEP